MDRDEDHGFWWIATALSVALVSALHFFGASEAPPLRPAAQTDARSPSTPVKSAPNLVVTRATSARAEPAIATVYECRQSGVRVFSDSPCGAAAEVRRVLAPNRMDAQAIFTGPQSTETPGNYVASPQGTPDEGFNHRSQCLEIQATKDRINARMREGYGAAEGEQLRERLRKLDDEYYELRCHTTSEH